MSLIAKKKTPQQTTTNTFLSKNKPHTFKLARRKSFIVNVVKQVMSEYQAQYV